MGDPDDHVVDPSAETIELLDASGVKPILS